MLRWKLGMAAPVLTERGTVAVHCEPSIGFVPFPTLDLEYRPSHSSICTLVFDLLSVSHMKHTGHSGAVTPNSALAFPSADRSCPSSKL